MANDAKYRLYLKKSDGQEIYAGEFTASGGADGISITGATINSKGHLILTLSNSQTVDAGEVKGSQGDKGAVYTPSVSSEGVISWTNNGNLSNPTPVNIKGKNGDPGVSVTGATIEDNGHLIVTLSKGDPIDAGYAKGDAPELSIVSNPTVGDDGHGVAFYVDGRQVEYFEVMDGDDGFSPIVEIQQTVSGHMVTITDKAHGEQSFEVLNGTGGGSGGGGSGLTHLVDGDKAGSVKSSGAADAAIGYSSFALGAGVSASGEGAFAQNFQTKASGKYSHAEGSRAEASGTAAHAEGMDTVASNYSAHAEGTGTIAAGEDQHVQGRYNVADADSKYAHIVGNGEHDGARANAHTLDWNGNAWFRGKVYIGGTGKDDPDAVELGAGGGSGGSVSWNDVTDKPFGEETRTLIFKEQVVELTEYDITPVSIPLDGEPVAGAKYVVKWGSETYECEGQDMSAAMGVTAIAIGNFDALTGGEGTGEPFVIVLFPEGLDEDTYIQIFVLNPADREKHVTIKIESVEVSKIPEDLLPTIPSIVFVNVSGEDPSEFVPDKSYLEAAMAMMSGQMVYLKQTHEDGVAILPCIALRNEGGILFAAPASTGMNQIYMWSPDGTFIGT